ncbi:PrsW family intramembrane metalloprotease [Enhygromyxa salina]|uniref:Protease PrsW n=1 Tax=Enhygromyxa salina TaxID=215803 RepID=A0A2S9Y5R8_9BACT|nr:PrsW family intramembrane metalloprotease [Enhygromyxa salina]PRQ00449.1 Protease PrsW [Enhygromyxa salina]
MYALLLASAVIPSALLLALFYFRDAFPEPPRVVLTTFVLGVVAVAPILGYIELHHHLFQAIEFGPHLHGLYRAFTLAAVPEELCKFAILMLYVRPHSAFDEPMDGLVYGASASLGFATLENLIYVDVGGWTTAIARATTAVPLHAMLGAIMGDYIARSRFAPEQRTSLLVRALVYPLILHGMYNAPLLVLEATPEAVPAMETQVYIAFVYMILGSITIQVIWVNYRLRKLQREQAEVVASLEVTDGPAAQSGGANIR